MSPWFLAGVGFIVGFIVASLVVYFLGIRKRKADMDAVEEHMKRFDENLSIVNGNVLRVSGFVKLLKQSLEGSPDGDSVLLRKLDMLLSSDKSVLDTLSRIESEQKQVTALSEHIAASLNSK